MRFTREYLSFLCLDDDTKSIIDHSLSAYLNYDSHCNNTLFILFYLRGNYLHGVIRSVLSNFAYYILKFW